MQDIIKQYFTLEKTMRKEKQFGRQVDIKIKLDKLTKQNNLTIKYTGIERAYNIYQLDKLIAKTLPVYSKRKIQLEYKVLKYQLVIL